jgi:hypothetical protein
MEIDMHLGRRTALTLVSGLTGLALSAVIAGPASAAPPPTSPPPALSAWLASPTQTTAAAPAAAAAPSAAAGASASLAKPAALVGKRDTFTRGGALAWSSDTFEWYWSGSSMSSSTAWQGDGYVFPNTVTLLGVKRTLAVAGQHNWRGTAAIGAGVVTPWGSVDVYSQTITDYFVLYPGGGITHSTS